MSANLSSLLKAAQGEKGLWSAFGRWARAVAREVDALRLIVDSLVVSVNSLLATESSFVRVFAATGPGGFNPGTLYGTASGYNSAVGTAAINTFGNSPIPAQGGTIRRLLVAYGNSGALLGVDTTFTVWLNGAATGLTATIPAGQAGPVETLFDVIVPSGVSPNQIAVQCTYSGAPGATFPRPMAIVEGRVAA